MFSCRFARRSSKGPSSSLSGSIRSSSLCESVVRAIFRFVLPIAIVMHCYTASTLFDDLHTGTDIMTNYTVYEAFNQAVIRYVT